MEKYTCHDCGRAIENDEEYMPYKVGGEIYAKLVIRKMQFLGISKKPKFIPELWATFVRSNNGTKANRRNLKIEKSI